MFCERFEVVIIVEQDMPVRDTTSGDNGVHRFANGDAVCSEFPIVFRRQDGDFLPTEVDHRQPAQQLPGSIELAFAREALQYFGQNEVAHRQRLHAQQLIEPCRFGALLFR